MAPTQPAASHQHDFLANPLDGWGNDDLLLTETAQKTVAERYPRAFGVFDWPNLRAAFLEHEASANKARRDTRVTGIRAIFIGYVGLVLSAASTIIPNNPLWVTSWNVAVAALGALLIAVAWGVGFFAVLRGGRKATWIVSRFWTERLRQFYFQYIINNFDHAVDAMQSAEALKTYQEAREAALVEFRTELGASLRLVIQRMRSDVGETDPWLRNEWSKDSLTPKESSESEELFDVLARQRFGVQQRYVESKLLPSFSSPQWRNRIIRGWGDGLTAVVMLLSLAVGLVSVVTASTSSPIVTSLAFFSAALSGLVVALRALGEGLQLNADEERYSWYLASVKSLSHRFQSSRGRQIRWLLLRDMEHLSYQELRRFILSADASRFIL